MAGKKTVTEVTPAPYVTIYESELQVIAGESASRDGVETGGDLFGAQTRAGRPLIYLATGPGPEATHAATRFTQDLEFFRMVNQVVEDTSGLQWRGTWHSHHELGLAEPSGGDTRKVKELTCRNDLREWMEIIVTYQRTRSGLLSLRRRWWSSPGRKAPVQVRAGAFVYTDPQAGKRVAAPIRILPGVSPFRLALLATGQLDRRALAEDAVCFPANQIFCDAFEPSAPGKVNDIPETLIAQIAELPEGAQRKLGLCVSEEVLVVTLELSDGRVADVGLAIAAPHPVKAVRVRSPLSNMSSDLTEKIAGEKLERLSAIYQALDRQWLYGSLCLSGCGAWLAAGNADGLAPAEGTKVDLIQ